MSRVVISLAIYFSAGQGKPYCEPDGRFVDVPPENQRMTFKKLWIFARRWLSSVLRNSPSGCISSCKVSCVKMDFGVAKHVSYRPATCLDMARMPFFSNCLRKSLEVTTVWA